MLQRENSGTNSSVQDSLESTDRRNELFFKIYVQTVPEKISFSSLSVTKEH